MVALAGTSGNVVDQYAYDLWGKPTLVQETVPQQLRYQGYWYDNELGWYWLTTRAYDPGLKRFLQPDPSEMDGLFSYAYVGDDPVDGSDPSGFGGCWYHGLLPDGMCPPRDMGPGGGTGGGGAGGSGSTVGGPAPSLPAPQAVDPWVSGTDYTFVDGQDVTNALPATSSFYVATGSNSAFTPSPGGGWLTSAGGQETGPAPINEGFSINSRASNLPPKGDYAARVTLQQIQEQNLRVVYKPGEGDTHFELYAGERDGQTLSKNAFPKAVRSLGRVAEYGEVYFYVVTYEPQDAEASLAEADAMTENYDTLVLTERQDEGIGGGGGGGGNEEERMLEE